MALSDERWLATIRRGEKSQHRVIADSAIPPVRVGERFWLRESYACLPDGSISYLADEVTPLLFDKKAGDWLERSWLPPAAMPRAFSRLTLEIIDIRLEHLQNCVRNGGLLAEGLPFNRYNEAAYLSIALSLTKRVEWMAHEWNDEHPQGSQWNENPRVWVLEWRVIHTDPLRTKAEGTPAPSFAKKDITKTRIEDTRRGTIGDTPTIEGD